MHELSSLMTDNNSRVHSGLKPSKPGATRGVLKDGARTKMLIADREGIFRLGLKKLFSVEDDLRVVAQAEDSFQLLEMAKSFKPDLMVIQDEIALQGDPNPLRRIQREWPSCRVIITGSKLTDTEWERFLNEGVSGVVARSAPPETLVETVRNVTNGGKSIRSPKGGPHQGPIRSQSNTQARPVDTLTSRERTIITCLMQGWRNREIAQHLTITEQTVKNHLRSIYDKVGVSDRLELALYAIHKRMDLPPLDSYT